MSENAFFGKLAVKEGLASQEQVAACLQELEQLQATGKNVHLGALMVHRGLLTRAQVRSVLDRQNKQVLRCPQCARTYTVLGLPSGKTMRCKDCQVPLRRTGADVLTGSELAESPRDSQLLDSESQVAPIIPASMPTKLDQTTRLSHPAGADALVGAVLSGKYELLEKIGQGGMGAVYRARHTLLERLSAVKILPPELAANSNLVERLQQEAKLCAQLDQKNVVQIYDVDSDQGFEYLAMEFIDGQDLDSLVQARKRLPTDQAISIARQAALGLSAAHQKGIIHRDIKPANLMITNQGVVKVMDFGLSRLIEGASHLSHTGQILGTPHYMSPEQARGEQVDHRTDIYSLGATLYLMVTGQTPFAASTPTALLLKAISEEPPAPHEVNGSVPRALSRVIVKMMSKEREQRYPDMTALLADLEKARQGEAVAAPATRPGGGPGLPTPGKRGLALIGAGLLLLALTIGLAVRGLPGGATLPDPPAEKRTDAAEKRLLDTVLAILDDPSKTPAEKAHACLHFARSFPDSPRAEKFRKLAAGYRAEQRPDPAALLAKLRAEVRRLISERKIGQAREQIESFLARHSDGELAASARKLLAELDRALPALKGTPSAKLLEQAEQAIEQGRFELAERLLAGLEKARSLLDAEQRKKLDKLRATLDVSKLPRDDDASGSSMAARVGLSSKWRQVRGDLKPISPDTTEKIALGDTSSWATAVGRWRADGSGLTGQGVLLIKRGPVPNPTVTARWKMPQSLKAGRSVGILISHTPPRGPHVHLGLGVQMERGRLFINKLTGDRPDQHERLANVSLKRPPRAGDQVLLSLQVARGHLLLKTEFSGPSGKLTGQVEYRLRFADRVPGDAPLLIGLFSAGQTATLESLAIRAGKQDAGRRRPFRRRR